MERFYHETMGYAFTTGDGRGRGPHRSIRFLDGPKNTLAYAAYALTSPEALMGVRSRLSQAAVEHATVSCPGLFTDAEEFRDPDGNRFIFGIGHSAAAPHGEPDRNERPARLQHFVTASTDPERVIAFFRDILGFVVSDYVLDDEGGIRTAFLRSSEEHHSFAVFKAPENRLDHHCYETRDWNAMRDWADHFAGFDIPLFWGPGRHGPGNNLFIFAHDPDGNSVELSAELEIIPDHRPTATWAHERKTLNSWGYGMMRS
ncbi:VOC family protein [Sphingobium subterraneum]|nr:VOC family protein [Sphingobium subterraneum]